MPPNSYSRVKPGDPPISYYLDSCLRVLGSYKPTERSSIDERVEVLLVLETARLYTWALALGIVNTTGFPSAVLELSSFYRQKSIIEVLRTLLDLLTDDNLITKAYGCVPRGPCDKDPNKAVGARTCKTAGIRLAEVFGNFRTSTRYRLKHPIKQWEITESEKFRLFVTEIRSLVSLLHGMTEQLLPRPVRNAMIYTRMWEIKYSWVASVIYVACDDLYEEIAAQARDLCDVLDVEDDEVADNVRGFIGFWDDDGGDSSHISNDGADDDDSRKVDRLGDVEKDLLALKHRVDYNELHPLQRVVSGPAAAPTNGKRPMPAENGHWISNVAPIPHDFPINGVGGPRAYPSAPYPQLREEPFQKPHPKGDVWNFEGDHAWDFDGNQVHGSPPPAFGVIPADDLRDVKTTKSTRITRSPQPEYTPSTSSGTPVSRDERNRRQWDDLSSDSDLSDVGMDSRSEVPAPPTKKRGRVHVSLDEQFQLLLLQQQAGRRQRTSVALQADAQARTDATSGEAGVDRGRKIEAWAPLQHFGPSSVVSPSSSPGSQPQEPAAVVARKQRDGTPAAAAAESLDEGEDVGRNHRQQQPRRQHHRHCGNCGEEMMRRDGLSE